MRAIAAPAASPQDINVHVIGHRWWWEFDYPDLGIKTANELHIPHRDQRADHAGFGGRDPQLLGASAHRQDGCHPRTDEPHVARGRMQTGDLHRSVLGVLRHRARPDAHDAVVDSPQATSTPGLPTSRRPAATPQTAARAGRVQDRRPPSAPPATPWIRPSPAHNLTGPNLAHLFSRSHSRAPRSSSTSNLRKWVHDTQAMKPGNDMDHQSHSRDLENVMAYLKLLK